MSLALALALADLGSNPNGELPTMNVKNITSANSPYAASPGQTIVVDASGGAVVINLPKLGLGQAVQVQQDSNTAFTYTITVNGPAGVNLDQPAPSNGTFVSGFVFGNGTTWTTKGQDYEWYNGGSAGGYLLA